VAASGGHNLLMLDEPSNHLDIPSAERLEMALREYDGTLLLITHDRQLLQDTVDELFVFEGGGRVRHFIGTYREWLETQAPRAAPIEEPAKPQAAATPKKRPPNRKGGAKGKYWHLSDEQLESQIESISDKLDALDQQLADPALYQDKDAFGDVMKRRDKLAGELEPLEAEWLKRAEQA
jgi:energy-coupling factor transporter ATP-binding protein EcfA2